MSIFDRLRRREWWRAPLVSTLIGSTVDSAIFFSIAFALSYGGTVPDLSAVMRDVLFSGNYLPLTLAFLGSGALFGCIGMGVPELQRVPLRVERDGGCLLAMMPPGAKRRSKRMAT